MQDTSTLTDVHHHCVSLSKQHIAYFIACHNTQTMHNISSFSSNVGHCVLPLLE